MGTRKKSRQGFLAAQRERAIIIEAPSAEELQLDDEPTVLGHLTWEAIPLQTFQSGIDDAKRQGVEIKEMTSMAKKSQEQPLL